MLEPKSSAEQMIPMINLLIILSKRRSGSSEPVKSKFNFSLSAHLSFLRYQIIVLVYAWIFEALNSYLV